MELTKLQRERDQVRRIFTRQVQQKAITEVDLQYLKQKMTELARLDVEIKNILLAVPDDKFNAEAYASEIETCEMYKRKLIELEVTHVHKTEKSKKHNMKLPKIQLRQFNDDPKNWLSFWGQFKKIHEDDNLDTEDKFIYLSQSMVEGSSAKAIVDSYPPSQENYKKVIELLHTRFANKEVLIEIYVRELIKLVVSKDSKITLEVLFDKIIVNLQILESLGIMQNKYDCILLPLIESVLPDGTLILWSKFNLVKGVPKLSQLLDFLKSEVEAEGRCKLARMALSELSEDNTPTASCLVAKEVRQVQGNKVTTGKDSCYFCDKNHNTLECMKAGSMSLEQKKDTIKKKGACYICLKKGHMAKNCKAFVKCICCSKRHLIVLCPEVRCFSVEAKKVACDISNHNNDVKDVVTAHMSNNNNVNTLLQTIIVKVVGKTQTRKVRALLDSGSQRTYIASKLAKELGLQCKRTEKLGHALFGGITKEVQKYRLYDFKVSSIDDKFEIFMTGLEQDKLCGTIPKYNSILLQKLKDQNIKLSDQDSSIMEISILIGADNLGSIIEGNLVHLSQNLVAMKTRFGWTLQGPTPGDNSIVCSNFVTATQEDSLEFMWSLETLGIKDPYEKENMSDDEILHKFTENISENGDGRYEVGLIWKEGPAELQSCYETAKRRLLSTTSRLEKMNSLSEYDEAIQEWKEMGIIEIVEKYCVYEGHYLPHHAVVKEESTTKVRPVFDASNKDKNGRSLNGCLERGPNLIEEIPKLLIAFRSGKYGVVADIKKAFCQISIATQDRSFLKFLWWKNNEMITYQHARVPFGVACSPFLLAATIRHHLEKNLETYPDAAKRLMKAFYVDNCITSFDTLKEVEKFQEEATELMQLGKFELRGWKTQTNEEEKPEPVLGLLWDRQEDKLSCKVNIKEIPNMITKRDLLSITQQIFDPIGMLSPVTIIPKLITQKAWILKTGWDEVIPKELELEYKEWIDTIGYINSCKIPRHLTEATLKHCEVSIHVFSDASKDSYAGCIFLRAEQKGKVTVQLIMAKSRVAPIKRQMSLPRLELMGALIASRLYREVKKSGLLELCKNHVLYCWTDSSVVVAWIRRQGTWKAFVTNRVKEICMNTSMEVWNHLPGMYNPADLPSRGCNSKKLLETHWWTGPEWLYLEKDQWPTSTVNETEVDEAAIASEQQRSTAVNVQVDIENFYERLQYFSQYTKIVRLVARLLRMSKRIREKYKVNSIHIGGEEYKNAEKTLIKLIQRETYTDMEKKDSKLTTIKEDDLIKVKTRLDYSKEDRDFIYPIILPGKNEIVRRMVQEKHKKMNHAGTQMMMTELRNTFWIIGVRRLTKKVVSECIICKRYKAKSYKAPEPPLPEDRIGYTAAFEITGIDLAGPLILKNNQKCWIVLFTCAVYRAVHLELTDTLSTAGFIMTLRRFISRRGRARVIYTDNGTNFLGTVNLLQEVNWDDVEDATQEYGIQWKFSVPSAPWWGGWWERLIRVVKEMLRRILGKASVDWIELSTILCDCEAVINNRPLTYVEMVDVRPLTPSMFLHSLATNDTPDLDQIDHKNVNVRYKYLQQLREDFRKRFKNEYLALIRSKGKETKMEPKVGDIVLIETESKRLQWPIGIIIEVFTGQDGCTRVAKVRTAHGEKVRAYQRLYPLEMSAPPSSVCLPTPQTTGKVEPVPILPLPLTSRSGRTIKLPHRFMD